MGVCVCEAVYDADCDAVDDVILVFVGGGVILYRLIVEQYIMPSIEKSIINYIDTNNYFRIIEKQLAICIPSTYFWLLGFYNFFHLGMNVLAELLRFGDR